MTELLKKEKEFVIPGDVIVESMDYLPGKNCFRDGEAIVSKKIGIVSPNNRVISVIALNGVYMPKVGDMVIATVSDIQSNGWILDINAPYNAYLPLSGIREFVDTSKTKLSSIFSLGDVLYGKLSLVNGDSVHVSMQDMRARKFRNGSIIKINPSKVPRVIGKQGSMINLIKDRTGCRISVGQNGFIWVDGGDLHSIHNIVEMIEKESYHDGLTDKVAGMLQGGERRTFDNKDALQSENIGSDENEKEEQQESE